MVISLVISQRIAGVSAPLTFPFWPRCFSFVSDVHIYIYICSPTWTLGTIWPQIDAPLHENTQTKTRKRKGRVVKDDSKPIMAFGKMGCFDSQPLLQLLPGSDLLGKLWWISGSGGCSSHTFTVLYCNYNIIIYKYIHTRILYICIFSWPSLQNAFWLSSFFHSSHVFTTPVMGGVSQGWWRW